MCTRGLRAALAGATALLLATGLLAAWPGDELGRVVSALPAGNSSGAEAAAGPRIEPSSAPAGGNTTPGPACGEAAVLNDVLSLPAPGSSPARGYLAINLDRPVPWNRYAWPSPSHLNPFSRLPAHSPPRPSTQPSKAGESGGGSTGSRRGWRLRGLLSSPTAHYAKI
ncbi:hypothetical protein DIPPA_23014 [Diplonema papillatum]|nr:hypothetical protein DIPPA_23014 [Diplonema papillatum]